MLLSPWVLIRYATQKSSLRLSLLQVGWSLAFPGGSPGSLSTWTEVTLCDLPSLFSPGYICSSPNQMQPPEVRLLSFSIMLSSTKPYPKSNNNWKRWGKWLGAVEDKHRQKSRSCFQGACALTSNNFLWGGSNMKSDRVRSISHITQEKDLFQDCRSRFRAQHFEFYWPPLHNVICSVNLLLKSLLIISTLVWESLKLSTILSKY